MNQIEFHPGRYDPVVRATIYSVVGHELYGDSHIIARIFGERKVEHGRRCMVYHAQIDNERDESGIDMGPYRYLKNARRNLSDILTVYLDGYPTLAGLLSCYPIRASRPNELTRDFVRKWVTDVAEMAAVSIEQAAEYYLLRGELPGTRVCEEEADLLVLALAGK